MMVTRRKHILLLMFSLVVLVGCQTATPSAVPAEVAVPEEATVETTTANNSPTIMPDTRAAPDSSAQEKYGVTNQRLDGNRVVEGYSDLSNIVPIDVELDGEPLWVASVPTENGVLWGVVLADGRTQAVLVADGVVSPVATEPARLPVGMPPLLRWVDGVATFIKISEDHSTSTNAVPIGDTLIGLGGDGDLIVDSSDTTMMDADVLPDARLLVDDQERLLFLSQPTERYGHAVLGDAIEAAAITLMSLAPEPRVLTQIELPSTQVIEGIAPIWADLDGDNLREILVTVSDADTGARIVAYGEDGSLEALGPSVGKGYRWRHQIAVAPFGPDGQMELAAILTPHIGGIVEFYQMHDGRLDVVAELGGYTSHVIGSRNLDMALAMWPSGGGQAVLLAPSQNRRRVGAIRHDSDGAIADWFVDVGGTMVTNMAAAGLHDDQVSIAVGRDDNVLRIWHPSESRTASHP